MELTNKAKILVLFANQYQITDEKTGEVTNSGTSVHYLFWGEAGENLITQSEWDASKSVGMQRAKVSLYFDARTKIPLAPAIYEGSFEFSVGSDGKPVLKLIDVAYVANVEMKEKVVDGLEVPGMIKPENKKG